METEDRKIKSKAGKGRGKKAKEADPAQTPEPEPPGSEPLGLTAEVVELPSLKNEDPTSFLDKLKLDWNLFWHGLVGDEPVELDENVFRTGRLQVLNVDQIKQITRALSQDRKKINQRIEQVNREIEVITERMESLNLVGSDVAEAVEQISKMHDIGQQLSHQLAKVSDQIDHFRAREDELKATAASN